MAFGELQLIWPVFVLPGSGRRETVPSMPGVFRLSLDELVRDAARAERAGVSGIAVFPVVPAAQKDERGSAALSSSGLPCRAASELRDRFPKLALIGDIALDPYTSHGHDGLLANGQVHNDSTVAVLAEMAVVHAQAGFDTVAPSDMMDGRVGAIRRALDGAGLTGTRILAYTAKYASAFYGPFRAALGSAQSVPIDKGTYQMDPGNAREALREAALDIAEGANMIMVKPGLPYLDIVAMLRQRFQVPIAAYQVSGEYALLRAAADAGLCSFEQALTESLIAFKRAGADIVFTYAAIEAAERAGAAP